MRLLILVIATIFPTFLFANGAVNGNCEKGGQPVVFSTFIGAPKVQASYPSCTITVYDHGTANEATLYSDNNSPPTSLGNPFTADTLGHWLFYAAQRVDVVMSGGGFSAPYTIYDIAPGVQATTLDCSQFPGEDASTQINNCLSSLPASGGIADARLIVGAQAISSSISIGANQTVLLGAAVFTCAISTDTGCILLGGNGAKVLGYNSGSQSLAAASQTGAIIRASGFGDSTDMIRAANGISTSTDSVEAAYLTLDFSNTSANTGRYGLYLTGVSNSWFHDLMIWNPGGDGVHVEASNAHSYSLTFDRIKVRAAGGNGFYFGTENGTADLDRIICNDCNYNGYNPGDFVDRFGENGVELHIPAGSAVQQGISRFIFNDFQSSGTLNGGNGMLLSQAGSGQIADLTINGSLFEDPFQSNTGTGLNVVSASAGNLFGINAFFDVANYSTGTNLSAANATSFLFRQNTTTIAPNIFSLRTDGLQFEDRATFTGGSTNTVKWYSSSGGQYSLGINSDGTDCFRRDDLNYDIFCINGQGQAISPAVDDVASLGDAFHRWAVINGVTNLTVDLTSTGAMHSEGTAAFDNGLSVGGGTATFKKYLTLRGTMYVGGGAPALANSCTEVNTYNIPGAADGDFVSVGVPAAMQEVSCGAVPYCLSITGYVVAADTVAIRVCNVSTTNSANMGTYTVNIAVSE